MNNIHPTFEQHHPHMIIDHVQGTQIPSSTFFPCLNHDYNAIIPMTSRPNILTKLINKYAKVRKAHLRSSIYYNFVYKCFFFLPSTVLASGVAILNFLIASKNFNANTNITMNLVAGCLGILIALISTLLGGFYVQAKEQAFTNSYNAYSDLLTKLDFYQYNTVNINTIIDYTETTVLKINSINRYSLPWFLQVSIRNY